MSDFYSLSIDKISRLTPNSVAVSFCIPEELQGEFAFEAGQYITIKHHVNGEEIRRSYSISSSPKDKQITVGIKKVPEGRFSVYANSSLNEGDQLELMAPEGRFVYKPSVNPENICAFAAGSGITPIMSIAKAVLDGHPENTFVLVYGNQNKPETMFYDEILELANTYKDRFTVQFVYSRAHEDDSLFGRIDASVINFILKNKCKDISFKTFYLCGPEDMITLTSELLKTNGVSEDSIYFELFTSSENEDEDSKNISLEGKTELEVVLDDEVHSLIMDKNTTVLDAVLDEDIDAPYSCQGGVCSTCIAKVTEGEAKMDKNQILTDSEIAEGLILTCQAHPVTATLKIDYDDV
ncbi:ferredoxin--NADP reductase [uncultured Eudoraea sp.]|uniref:ferredoxin--NADP reductase n=1 Tax=uncultured Eudoraea sp. TaxID=1035614 RepID=UPI00261BF7EF|nr:ferredoxin--NADP reductase [uncultured Eudoraea sp.]